MYINRSNIDQTMYEWIRTLGDNEVGEHGMRAIQQQLSEINNRYDMFGIRLGDRDRGLANMKEELRSILTC